ncbi:MAG TPA: CvpA family protein [Candidatus Acidoferrum sp.]|nr:CvpA family protein [Candidatus Acidoferrum sp.]
MTIWLLVLVLVPSVAAMGYRQGGVRAAFSTIGILFGALLAKPLGRLLRPLLVSVGVRYPELAWLVGALLVFVIISIAFKVGAYMVHQKVDVHYKYHAGDLRLALWERLNRRLGLCVGALNGALYCMLLAAVVYPFSYWSFQLATPDKDPKSLVILNRLGQDMQSTGFSKVAGALDPMPQVWYHSADLAGLIYNNPLSAAGLEHYPAFLGLAERPEFQNIAADTRLTEDWQKRTGILDFVDHPTIQAVLNNPGLAHEVWTTVLPDMQDLIAYLQTGKSAKYDAETILGRWNFDVSVALALDLRNRQSVSSREMQRLKEWFASAYAKTRLVAKTGGDISIKNLPAVTSPGAGAASGSENVQGKWKNVGGKYQISFTTAGREHDLAADVDSDRLTMTGDGMTLVFNRAD